MVRPDTPLPPTSLEPAPCMERLSTPIRNESDAEICAPSASCSSVPVRPESLGRIVNCREVLRPVGWNTNWRTWLARIVSADSRPALTTCAPLPGVARVSASLATILPPCPLLMPLAPLRASPVAASISPVPPLVIVSALMVTAGNIPLAAGTK